MYFNQKLTVQNNKINGMFDLVNTMAEELNYVRTSSSIQPLTTQTPFVNLLQRGGTIEKDDELIHVSDDDSEEEYDDDDESEEDDSDDESEEEDDDDEEDDHDKDDYVDDDNRGKNIKIINILSDSIYGVEHNDAEIIEDENNNESDDDSEDNEDDHDENDLSNEDDEPVELIDLINHNVLHDDTTDTKDMVTISSNGENYSIDLNLLKNINISSSSSNENIDYKKMSLNRLREIVVERNLTQDSSKMKKNELLKLLE
jgi:hypothetical protein